MDTIFALATARGKAGVAVIRLSGPDAWTAGAALAGALPGPRQTALRVIRDAEGQVLDTALVLCFAAGHSFTGEQVVELHLHGSPAILKAVMAALAAQPGLRLADPGEFTRRALENGCLDLAQVEGLGDLIEAETEAQRKQAQRVFEGALGARADQWRRDLIRAVSLLEATIDFADEDVPYDVTPEVLALLNKTQADLKHESVGSKVAERIREGFEVAIVGPPNAGKSTLLNRLAGREAAITSEIAGTTRDVIEVRMDLNGLPVTMLDTAGLRETQDHVETLGIARAVKRAEDADLRVFLLERAGDTPFGLKPREGDVIVFGKADLSNDNNELTVSGKTGAGVTALIGRIEQELQQRAAGAATATRLRHRQAIDQAIELLDSARDVVLNGPEQAELASADLHRAIRALDSLIGRVDVEHVLDEIFASFCLGK
jgi:tRNA modification GTPase